MPASCLPARRLGEMNHAPAGLGKNSSGVTVDRGCPFTRRATRLNPLPCPPHLLPEETIESACVIIRCHAPFSIPRHKLPFHFLKADPSKCIAHHPYRCRYRDDIRDSHRTLRCWLTTSHDPDLCSLSFIEL